MHNARITGTATASSSAGAAHAPGNALDDSFDTAWRAAGRRTQWLQVDLGEPHVLTSVRQTFAEQDVWRFTVTGSLDGSTWATLMDRSTSIAGQSFASSVSGVYRYVRLTVTGAKHGSIASSKEFLLQGSATEAQATPAGVTASSQANGYEASYATDRDSSTYWVAGNGSLPQWIQLDLGEVTELTAVEQNFKDYDRVSFQIAGSTDNQNWTMLADHSAGTRGQSFHEPVTGAYRYVRLTITATEDGHWAGSTGFKAFIPLNNAVPDLLNRNLASGTTATSSSLSVGFEPWFAVEPGGEWIAADPNSPQGSGPQRLTVDLGNASQVSGVEQAFIDDDTWRFVIDGSLDNQNWTRLADHSAGATGRVFRDTVDGTYRYIRLTVNGPSARGHWPCSQELKVFGNGSPLENRRWIERSGPMQRFYPKHYGTKLTEITDQLDDLKEQGYQGIEIAAPYKGPRTPWAGLGATDNYDIDPSIGTMADFEHLLATAHQFGMRVVMFGNAGYSSPEAPFWIKAQQDPNSVERKWFDIVPASGPYACDAAQRRYWSELARGCYFSFWTDPHNPDNHMPAYNFGNQEWRDEASKYLKFWMDKGIDGFGMDAPRAYLNISTDISNRYLTNVLNNYDSWTLPEGLQPDWGNGAPGDLLNGVRELRYNTIHDLYISWWGCTEPCSRIVPAIHSGDPRAIEGYFKASRDAVNQQHGVTILPPSWDSDINQADGSVVPERLQPADVRLLEMATILFSGNQFIMHYGNHMYLPHERTIPTWTAAQQTMVDKLLRAQGASSAFDPKGLRFRLPTGDDAKAYAFLRTDKASNTKALVVLNYQNAEQTVEVQLANSGISLDQVPIDVLDGRAGDPISGGTYRVTLPARGFAVLSVR